MSQNIVGEIGREDIHEGPVVRLSYRWWPFVWLERHGQALTLRVYRFVRNGRSWACDISLNGRDHNGLRLRRRIEWFEIVYLKVVP